MTTQSLIAGVIAAFLGMMAGTLTVYVKVDAQAAAACRKAGFESGHYSSTQGFVCTKTTREPLPR